MSATARERAAHLGPERRRPELLEVAQQLFLERGYQGASISEIARRAGVTRPVVYDCFPNKEELFSLVRERIATQILSDIAAAIEAAEASAGDLEAMFRAGFTTMLRAAVASPEAFRYVYLDHRNDPGVEERSDREHARHLDALEAVARVVLERAGIADIDTKARLAAHVISGVGDGAVRAVLSEGDRFEPDATAAFMARLLARGATAV